MRGHVTLGRVVAGLSGSALVIGMLWVGPEDMLRALAILAGQAVQR